MISDVTQIRNQNLILDWVDDDDGSDSSSDGVYS